MKQRKSEKQNEGFARLNPLNDYLFKQYMGTEECKSCLISFLNAVLELRIAEIKIISGKELHSEIMSGKLGRLDILAKLKDKTLINIEAQILDRGNISERTVFYNGRLYVSGINAGEDYLKLKKTISINILGYNMGEFQDYEEFHTQFHFRSKEHPELILTDKTEIHFIELKISQQTT